MKMILIKLISCLVVVAFTANAKADDTDLRQLITECKMSSSYKDVLITYLDQHEDADYSDINQLSYSAELEVRDFIETTLLNGTNYLSKCSELTSKYRSFMKYVSEEVEQYKSFNFKTENTCNPSNYWRNCSVDTAGGRLNLRRMPGVKNSYTRIDGFYDGEKVKAMCTFGDWALVYGSVSGRAKATYGWSHREYLKCDPSLNSTSTPWRG